MTQSYLVRKRQEGRGRKSQTVIVDRQTEIVDRQTGTLIRRRNGKWIEIERENTQIGTLT